MEQKPSFFSGIIRGFLDGNMALLLILISLAVGGAALLVTPREEEPQIVVPMADVLVAMPGESAATVEKLVSSRLERMLHQIDGVEYVYSMSRPGQAVVTVRFYVGQDREESLIKLYNKIFQNIDRTTPGIAGWVVKPVEIDDVPIWSATLYSGTYDTHQLYRVAEEVAARLQQIPDSARVTVHGGEPRVLKVDLDAGRLTAHGLTVMDILGALKVSNARLESGSVEENSGTVRVEAGPFLAGADEVRGLVVGVHGGRPVYLRDVAEVADGAAEAVSYTRFRFGPAAGPEAPQGEFPAVTVALAKKKGSNAVRVARAAAEELERLRGSLIPDEVQYRVTRDYGQTADDKVNDLVKSLAEAIITVIALVAFVMNWRVGLIVALAVPITYSLTLMVNLLAGYTINRVTLFALILALGLLVDDPIVAVENIYRHIQMRTKSRRDAVLAAMGEIMPPVVLATLSVIVAFIPMLFITGMMGPYMRPMALNVPLAMLCSMLVSFAITPWVSSRMLKDVAPEAARAADVAGTRMYRIYSAVMTPFIRSRRRSWALLGVTAGLFALSVVMALTVVPLKMLPFDNKNEFQIVVDMPESVTLEVTDAAVRDFEDYLRTIPEVTDVTSYVGLGSPMDFNGMVRHYFLRRGPNVADIRVNLLHRKDREMDSHGIVLRVRRDLEAIARRNGVAMKIVEVPPGPPVLSTVVAEVYGGSRHSYEELCAAARTVEARLREERGVVDVDTMIEDNQREWVFETDRSKAAANGVSTEDVTRTLAVALGGAAAGSLHVEGEQNEMAIVVRLPREARSSADALRALTVRGRAGQTVHLGEIGAFREKVADKTIFHKNQERVVYVTAETAGRGPAYAVLAVGKHFTRNPLPEGIRVDWAGEGEWKITVDVFRDLGIAFAAALLAIYMLLVYETKSYALPGVIMLSIPLTMIGIMPGFWGLNLIVNRPVGGFDTPVFFTATAMIGMIALAGIVVRNGIILIDFIRHAVAEGRSMDEAIVESGAVRFRPIVLTAGTTLLGAWPITMDPIFSGLAWSLMFGLFVSTAFTLVVIPTVYKLLYGERKHGTTEERKR